MNEYTLDNKTYIDLKDVRTEHKDYCKGTRSHQQLIERKSFSDYIFGRVDDGELIKTEKLSRKFGSIFVNKVELAELFETEEALTPAPPLITDEDLVFFKDEDGNQYNVPMRGERTQDGIFFRVKSVMEVFNMASLSYDMARPQTMYSLNEHYMFFKVSNLDSLQSQQIKEMYLTYAGLRKVIETSRSGVGYKFKKWIDEIVFSATFGTNEQKVETFKKVLNVDANHLKAIMTKSATDISCLYLIDIGVSDNNKKVFKYGFTDNVKRRFSQHMKHYGDDIKLDSFIFIPVLSLSSAETEFKKSVSRYQYLKEGHVELISLCDESYLNIKNIFKTISDSFCGNMKNQIAQYESMMSNMKHAYEIETNNLRNLLVVKDSEIKSVKLQSRLDLALKDNEILTLKLQIQSSH